MEFISYQQGNDDLSNNATTFALDDISSKPSDSIKLNPKNHLMVRCENELDYQPSEPQNPNYDFIPENRHLEGKAILSDYQDPSLSPSDSLSVQTQNSDFMSEDSSSAIGKIYDDLREDQEEENPPQYRQSGQEILFQKERSEQQSNQLQPTLASNNKLIEQILNSDNYLIKHNSLEVSVRPTEQLEKLIADQATDKPATGAAKSGAPNHDDYKNFIKKLGDQFCDDLVANKIEGCKKIFKDRTSWQMLNDYCSGKRTIPRVSHKAFTKMLLDFVKVKRPEDFKGKSGARVKLLHMVSFMCLKLACKEIENSGAKGIFFKQGTPAMVIKYNL